MRIDRHRALRFLASAAEIVMGLALVMLAAKLAIVTLGSRIPFDTDEADHANASLELFRAVSGGGAAGVLSAIFRQSFYPPLFSFFGASSYAIFGVSLAASRLPSVLFLVLSCLALSGAVGRSAEGGRRVAKWTAVVLMFLSPILLVNASLCMLELLGVLGACVCLLCAGRLEGSARSLALGVLGALVALSKYNFGLMILPAILGADLLAPGPRGVLSRLLSLAPAVAGFSILFGLFLFGADLRSVIQFFVGHPSYAPILSSENIFFDLRAWIFQYEANPIIGAGSLVLAAFGAISGWRRYEVRFAACLVIATLSILFLSTTNEVRHFIIAAPGIWFLAGLGLARIFGAQGFRGGPAILGAALLWTISLGLFARLFERLPVLVFREQEGMAGWSELGEFIAEGIEEGEPALISGSFDSFGLETLRWYAAADSGRKYTEVRLDPFPFSEQKARSAAFRKRNTSAGAEMAGLNTDDFGAVIRRDYYRSVVLIIRGGKLLPEQTAIRTFFAGQNPLSMYRDGVRAEIFRIPSEPSLSN